MRNSMLCFEEYRGVAAAVELSKVRCTAMLLREIADQHVELRRSISDPLRSAAFALTA